jgi:hypothetical protein
VIAEEELALWRQARESPAALDVYLDYLLIHDPIRGEMLRKRMQNGELVPAEYTQESRAWSAALGFADEVWVACKPLPWLMNIGAARIAELEPVLDLFPFLHIRLDCTTGSIDAALASPVMTKIRALSYSARGRDESNYQSDPIYCFGSIVLNYLCASPNITQLEALWLGDEPGYDCAQRLTKIPFVGLRELRIEEAEIEDHGVIAIASSPIIKTLRRLELIDSGIGNAGALALARDSQLEELAIRGHRIGAAAASALRAMPSLKRLELAPDV